jgi:DNA-3-methyladenine glycosylase
MFGPPGHLYVYFTYGMHFCANIVTAPAAGAGAVLLRGAVPVWGREAMRARRSGREDLCDGPAKLSQAFGLARAHNGLDLCVPGSSYFVADDASPPMPFSTTRRIGLRPGRGDDFPWRFVGLS